jgi:hypothetical protein
MAKPWRYLHPPAVRLTAAVALCCPRSETHRREDVAGGVPLDAIPLPRAVQGALHDRRQAGKEEKQRRLRQRSGL